MEENRKHINRHNYQEWFLDYMEGNLSAKQKDQLDMFLANQPDLAMEFAEVTNGEEFNLAPETNKQFPHHSKLKRAPHPYSEFSEYNYLLIKHNEEGLTETEEKALEFILKENPKGIDELKIYSKLKLQTPALEMPGRNSLLRHTLKVNYFAAIKAVAASVLIFVLFNYRENVPLNFSPDNMTIAQISEITPIDHQPVFEPGGIPRYQSTFYEIAEIRHEVEMTNEPDVIEQSVTEPMKSEYPDPEIIPISRPKLNPIEISRMPNSYEAGLALMLPQYLDNRRLMAQLDPERAAAENEDTKSLLEQAGMIFRNVNPLSNLAYSRIYDEEGEVVAINVSSDNFELIQRLPKWFVSK